MRGMGLGWSPIDGLARLGSQALRPWVVITRLRDLSNPGSGRQPCHGRIGITAVENLRPRPKSPMSRTHRQRDRRIGRRALETSCEDRAFVLALAGFFPIQCRVSASKEPEIR